MLTRSAAVFLQAAGITLILLGLLHLLATPNIPHLLDAMPPLAYQHAVGPTTLNHVLVGLLLLPLGFSTWVAAGSANRNAVWARRILLANALTVATFPVALVIFMRRPEYYHATLFVAAVTLVIVIALCMLTAAAIMMRASK